MTDFLFDVIATELEDAVGRENCSTRTIDKITHSVDYFWLSRMWADRGLRMPEGDFIVALNSKRKNAAIEYKKIPIIDALRPYIHGGIPELPTPQLLRRRVSAALPNHKLYDLRTTFYTRCDEYGVAPPARDEFVGHSAGALTNAYRDLSDEYLLKEGKKLNEWR